MSASTRGRFRGPALTILLWACAAAAGAQLTLPGARPAPATPAAAPEEAEADVYGRGTPSGTLFGFLRAAERGNLKAAGAYLELPPGPQGQREQIARELRVVFDRRFVTANLDRVSRLPQGAVDDGLEAEYEKIGEIRGDAGMIDVVVVRRASASGPPVWLISANTVRECRALYQKVRGLDIETRLPAILVQTRIFGMSLFQALAAVLLLPVLYGVAWVLVGLVLAILRRIRSSAHERGVGWDSARSPATFILTLLLHRMGVSWLALPALYRLWYDRGLLLLIFVGLLWLVARLIDAFDRRLLARVAPAGAGAGHPTLGLARRFLKIAAFVVILLVALASFGVNLTATLTGLGIGGLALAFAAQKSLGNVFGGIAILADRALRIGDTCRIGGVQGEIEDITLWAVRLRTQERTVVSIPNGVVMESQIENLSRRDKFWFHPILGLVCETTAPQLGAFLEGARAMLAADARVEHRDARVHLIRSGASSLDVEVSAYVRVPSQYAFLGVQEDLLLRLIQLVADSGTALAFPTQTVLLRAADPAPGGGESRP